MPDEKTTKKAQEDLRGGKAPTTAAGEFVREKMDHIREGKHGARSTRQAIAIGLSKARARGRAAATSVGGHDLGADPGVRRARVRDRSGQAKAPRKSSRKR